MNMMIALKRMSDLYEIDYRECYMKSCLSSLVLSSSFLDLVVKKKTTTDRVRRKKLCCCSVSLLLECTWGLRIVDIKPSKIFGIIWCVPVFSTLVILYNKCTCIDYNIFYYWKLPTGQTLVLLFTFYWGIWFINKCLKKLTCFGYVIS